MGNLTPGMKAEIGGCVGCCAGVLLGAAMAIAVMVASAAIWGPPIIELSLIFAGLIILIGGAWGVEIGAHIGGKAEVAVSSVPPNVEEAARTRFTLSTKPPIVTEDRIKQPGEDRGKEPDGQSGLEQ
jgi:hypothetical protein